MFIDNIKNSKLFKFFLNLGLLLFGILMAFSGFLLQIGYHMGNHGEIDTSNVVYGLDYYGWSDTHKISILLVSVFVIFHIILHWKWYMTIVRKKLVSKNRQVITLTIIFILVAITGYLPWLIKLGGGSELTRKMFLEIHDKITLVLIVYLILHVTKRFKWYINFLRVK